MTQPDRVWLLFLFDNLEETLDSLYPQQQHQWVREEGPGWKSWPGGRGKEKVRGERCTVSLFCGGGVLEEKEEECGENDNEEEVEEERVVLKQ